jgi:hypothetical protein
MFPVKIVVVVIAVVVVVVLVVDVVVVVPEDVRVELEGVEVQLTKKRTSERTKHVVSKDIFFLILTSFFTPYSKRLIPYSRVAGFGGSCLPTWSRCR